MQREKVEKIRFRALSKSFGDLLVLKSLDFCIYDNEFLCLVGPTGCGKTTLANIVSRLLPPSSGSVTMGGVPVDPRRHNIAFVFQEPSCLPWRNVRQNVQIGLEVKKYPRSVINERVDMVLELMGLTPFQNYYPHQLSGGMKQRVAIARAFCAESDLMIMDEPFAQNDEKTRFEIEGQLLATWAEMKRTILFVTHNLEEAVFLAERIIVLTQKPTGIKAELAVDLERPRDITSPQFLGIRNQVTELVKWW